MLSKSPWAHKSGDATVLWLSAEPIQMALARQEQGSLSLPAAPRRMKAYVIRVVGIAPGFLPKDYQERREMLMRQAKLLVRGMPDIVPDEVKVTDEGLEFWFPPDRPITTATKQVDFSFRAGKQSVRARFLPPEMVFKGQPAL